MRSLLFFFSHQMIALKKSWKMLSSKTLSSFSRCSTYFPLPLSLEKIIEDKILNLWRHHLAKQDLETYIVWYLEKESSSDIETSSIDTVLNDWFLWKKVCRKCASKASPRHIFNFGKCNNKPMHVINYFENEIFWKRIIKKKIIF